jgi:hypothetical protein
MSRRWRLASRASKTMVVIVAEKSGRGNGLSLGKL